MGSVVNSRFEIDGLTIENVDLFSRSYITNGDKNQLKKKKGC